MLGIDEDDLYRRGMSAYWRGRRDASDVDQPNRSMSGVRTHGGKVYVVFRTGNRVLAVYRVRNDGMLKGLRRWPAAVVDA